MSKTAPATITPIRRWLRTCEAAAYMGKSQWKLRQLVLQGKLHPVEDGERAPWQFDIHELDAYMEKHKRNAGMSDLTTKIALA